LGCCDNEEKRLDGILEVFENSNFSCFICKHLNEDTISCKAFPDGIPNFIITGQLRHTEKMFRQKNDIVFEPIKKK
jgi:hypothetical protein